MNLHLLAQKTLATLQEGGIAGLWRKVRTLRHPLPVEDARFDQRHGTDTGGFEPLWKFSIDSPHAKEGVHYKATQEAELLDAFGFIAEPLPACTFVDLGCGKGKPVLIAAMHGAKRAIGVEFASELAQVAQTNLVKLGLPTASIIHGDAARFRFPSGPLILYLYNPFGPTVMNIVIANLKASDASPIYVIYKNPNHAGLFDEFLTRTARPRPNMQIWRS